MVTPVLPKAQSTLASNQLRDQRRVDVVITGEWLDFLRDLLGRVNEDEGLAAEIEALILRIESLEGAQIIGTQSVQVFGSLSAGLVNLLLRGDEPTPSPLFYYGTGPTGSKGFWPAASLVEYLVDENGDYLVDENGNFLIGADITADLFAIVATSSGIVAHTGVGTWEARTLTEGAGIDITNGSGVAGNPTIAHEDTSSVANLTSDNSGTVVLQDITFTFDTFGHVLTATVGTVDVATALAGTFQPLDATLTALAAANWAANAVPIGSGADTVSQVAFAANTFPARASTGNLVAKTITDEALALVADADVPRLTTTNAWSGVNTYSTTVNFSGASTDGQIRFTGTAGGGNEGFVYTDSGAGLRFGLFFPGSDIVALGNRASNGVVHLRANTVTAGAAGEVTCAVVSDTDFSPGTDNTKDLGTASLRWSATYTVESRVSGAEYLTGVSTPAQFTANTDNFATPATARVLRMSSDASRNLTGLQGGASGRRLTLSNVGAQDIVLVHDATSTAANRFLCPSSANMTLGANDNVETWYDATSSRWRVFGL